MNEKIQWLRNKMAGINIQGLIISNPVSVKYLTNIDAEGILLLTRKENVYITDGRYIEDVQNTITISDEIVIFDAKDLSIEDNENFFLFCENVGFEENYVTYAKYKEYIHKYKINSLVETDNLIENQRMLKDEEELKKIKKACEITHNCFNEIVKKLVPGKSEIEIAREINNFFNENGVEPAFDTIVASGSNSSKPHAVPTDRVFEEQDIVLIDIGCKYKGYCSDMTRTFFIGEPTEKQKNIYDLVKKNHDQTIKQMHEGINCKMLTKMVENDFNFYKYDLIHSLGHGVGLEIHERPFMSSRKDFILRENMVVTVEPGIYIPNEFGVRIEDTVQVSKYSSTIL